MWLYSLCLLSHISNTSTCCHALFGRDRTPTQIRTYWEPHSRCWWSLWPLHCWLYSQALWLNQIYVCPYLKTKKKHTCKISAQDLDTTYFFRGILRWKNYLLQAKNLIRPAKNFNKKVLLCVYPPPSSDVPSSVLLMLEAGLPVLPGPFCWFAVVAFLAGCSLWWNSFSGTMCTFWLFNRPE